MQKCGGGASNQRTLMAKRTKCGADKTFESSRCFRRISFDRGDRLLWLAGMDLQEDLVC